jgi:DNA-binding transcriptional MerR regulator
MHSKWLSAGEFSKKSSLSPKALRLYAQNGLLLPAEVDQRSGYRGYDPAQLLDARMIRLLRRAGMPMQSVAEVMAAPREQRDSYIASWWDRAAAEFTYRRSIIEHLSNTMNGGKDHYIMLPVTTRVMPEQTLITEQAYVYAQHLRDWIVQAGLRQLTAAAAVGGQVEASIVIYHGEVSEDSDGPVESAIPIDPIRAGKATLPTRVEPSHLEAFVTITRSQVRYPDILSAYDAVEAWIAENDAVQAGSPREYYFGDPSTGPEDEAIAHVAFPIQLPDRVQL